MLLPEKNILLHIRLSWSRIIARLKMRLFWKNEYTRQSIMYNATISTRVCVCICVWFYGCICIYVGCVAYSCIRLLPMCSDANIDNTETMMMIINSNGYFGCKERSHDGNCFLFVVFVRLLMTMCYNLLVFIVARSRATANTMSNMFSFWSLFASLFSFYCIDHRWLCSKQEALCFFLCPNK